MTVPRKHGTCRIGFGSGIGPGPGHEVSTLLKNGDAHAHLFGCELNEYEDLEAGIMNGIRNWRAREVSNRISIS